jgi:Ni/Fe-hydrogenase subunit HybB-like protein
VHLDNLGKLLIVLSLIWTYINILELFSTWYGGASFELEALRFRLIGFYAPLYWEMILFCAFVPLLMLSRKIRLSWNKMLVISILINIGMLTERFIIVATSQPRKFLPDAFGFYFPSWVEISITIGSFGIFATLFLIFIKWVPAVSLYEVKETLTPLRRRA